MYCVIDHVRDEIEVRRVDLWEEPARVFATERTNESVICIMPEDPVRLHLGLNRREFSRCMMKSRPLKSARFPVPQCIVLLIGVKQELSEFGELCVATVV